MGEVVAPPGGMKGLISSDAKVRESRWLGVIVSAVGDGEVTSSSGTASSVAQPKWRWAAATAAGPATATRPGAPVPPPLPATWVMVMRLAIVSPFHPRACSSSCRATDVSRATGRCPLKRALARLCEMVSCAAAGRPLAWARQTLDAPRALACCDTSATFSRTTVCCGAIPAARTSSGKGQLPRAPMHDEGTDVVDARLRCCACAVDWAVSPTTMSPCCNSPAIVRTKDRSESN
mmetsp:Transcript_14693/g.46106  ORF Transcript_14693/g.46106 Transcript_14693/m.46106 type:complete len:234 (+) Transcript_14693:1330-2031(+)